MKNLVFVIAVTSFSLIFAAANVKADSIYPLTQKNPTSFISHPLHTFTRSSKILQDSVTRWNPTKTKTVFGNYPSTTNFFLRE